MSKQKAEEFKAANAQSPVVSAGWLDHSRRVVTKGPDTWVYQQIELKDGRKFTLGPAVLDVLHADNYQLKWDL